MTKPSSNIAKIREFLSTQYTVDGQPTPEWVSGMSDEELAKWLNEPEQKKLWKDWWTDNPHYNNGLKDDTENDMEPPKHFLWNKGRQPGVLAPLDKNDVANMVKTTGLHPDVLFMHDALFAEGDDPQDIPLSYNDVYHTPDEWWTDSEIDEKRRLLSNPLDDRVDRYLKESNDGSNERDTKIGLVA